MTNHPNRSNHISGSHASVAGECIRQHNLAHERAMSLPRLSRDGALTVAGEWSQAADWAVNARVGDTRRLPIGRRVYTLTIV